MTRILFIAASLFAFQNVGLAHDDDAAGNALAAHNALHYVEHLVDQQKLDDGFTSALKTIALTVDKDGETVKGYKALLAQVPGEDGKAISVEVTLDATAKATDFTAIAGTKAIAAPVWPDADSITLVENALHAVLHGADKPEIDPFNDGLSSLVLSQQKAEDGTVTAQVDIKATGQTSLLRVVLSTDGTVQSMTVVPQ